MYSIYGRYEGGSYERIDTVSSRSQLEYLLGEYRLAFGAGWSFRVKKGGRWIDEF